MIGLHVQGERGFTPRVVKAKPLTHYERTIRYRKKHPWFVSLRMARERCNRPGQESYYRYGARGIKCTLTNAECKKLWERDGAASMKKPSIDRIEDGDYTFANCRFIELSINVSAPKHFQRVGGTE